MAAETNSEMDTQNVQDHESEALVSTERLSSDSPVMWPDQNFCECFVLCDLILSASHFFIPSHLCSW